MKQTLIFIGLSAVALAHTGLKGRLAQQAACVCALPAGGAGAQLPGLNQGTYTAYEQASSVTNGVSLTTLPDTSVLTQGAAECCACNSGSHAAAANGSKSRHFDILGGITMNETVTWFASGNFSSESSGQASKQSASQVSNVNGNTTGSGLGQCVSSCPTPLA